MLMCIATVTQHFLDGCNRPDLERRTHILRASTEAALLEAMAAYQIRLERADSPEEAAESRADEEYCEVAFGPIMVIASTKPCTTAALQATDAWQANLALVQARQAAAVEEATAIAAAEAVAREAAARAVFLELKARFEPESAPGMWAP